MAAQGNDPAPMTIIVRLDVMMAQRKIRGRELAEIIGITEQNLSLLKSGKVKGMRFDTLARLCAALACQPGDLLEAVPEGGVPEGGMSEGADAET